LRRTAACTEPGGLRRPRFNAAWAAFVLSGLGLALGVTACRGTGQPATTTPAAGGLMSEQAAIDAALRIAMSSQPEISGSLVLPREIRARQTTLASALQTVLGHDASIPAGYKPDMIVWVVTMEGWWTDEFPRPTDSPTPEPYRHLAVILDAGTGQEIESSHQP
jgi:hypothetical protein